MDDDDAADDPYGDASFHNVTSTTGVPSMLNYRDARRLAQSSDEIQRAGLVVVQHSRHVTLAWHMCGRGAIGLRKLFELQLGKYQKTLAGVPLALGSIRSTNASVGVLIIDDQPCMHLDVIVSMVVFCPKIGHVYLTKVIKVDDTWLTAIIHNHVTVLVQLTARRKPSKRHQSTPQINSTIPIRIEKIIIHKSMCQLRGCIAGDAVYTEPDDTNTSTSKPIGRLSMLSNVLQNHRRFNEKDDETHAKSTPMVTVID